MARITYQEAKQVVTNLLQSAGGEMTRIDLDKKLYDAGQGEIVGHLKALAEQGVVKKRVVAQPEGKAILYYRLP